MENSNIAWTDDTVNFWIGCDKVSEGCTKCYAEYLDAKFKYGGQKNWGKNAPRFIRTEKAAYDLGRSFGKAIKTRRRRRVFINSMSDFFEDREDLIEPRIAAMELFERSTLLDIQLLTKRPENIMKMVLEKWKTNWPWNVWIGTSVENQKWADIRIPILLKVPARIRWLSCEPLLGHLNLIDNFHGIRWVVAGGESGAGFRQMNMDDMRTLHGCCRIWRTAFFAKQDSGQKPGQRGRIPDDLWVQEFPV